jgi:hypothetical protein
MRFHFLLTNHYPYGCGTIEDYLTPIAAGLTELGHNVTYGFDDDVVAWPDINLLVEFFNDPAVVDQVIALKTGRTRHCFGLICPYDVEDPRLMADADFPDRRPNLDRLLPYIDFVWTLVPNSFEPLLNADQVRRLRYGYVAALRRNSPLPRDIDVVLYGDPGGRRGQVFAALAGRGLKVDATFELSPAYVRLELIDRARVVLDMPAREARFLNPPQIVMPLLAGRAVVSENFDTSPLAELYRYTAAAGLQELVDLCVTIARSGRADELGATSRDSFAQETSMAANLQQIMDLPVFAELAA